MQRSLSLPLAVAALSTALTAQYSTDFEALTASTAGTSITGQDGYYIPTGTTSIDFNVYTYTGNALGIPANPNGGNQFIAGTGPASPTFARAQRDMTYGAGTGVWTLGFDICGQFSGTLPTAQNLGSFSVQPYPGSQALIALARWSDINTATTWNADYVWFDAAGTAVTETVSDPAFQNLAVNQWYRWETDIDLASNRVIEVRITDVATGTTTANRPVDRYLEGGSATTSPVPTGFRFFAGGGVAGNTLAFDNASVEFAASYFPYGTGCPGSNGLPPSLDAQAGSKPTVGGSITVEVTDMPAGGGFAIMALGFDNTMWAGMPLPMDLTSFQLPGCSLLIDLVDTFFIGNAGGTGTWTSPIPNQPNFVGLAFYNQAFVFDPGVNPRDVTASNGGAGQVGN